MFILPNNKVIDYEVIIDAMLDQVNRVYWLNAETGECLLDIRLI
jgi:hypothetical protein